MYTHKKLLLLTLFFNLGIPSFSSDNSSNNHEDVTKSVRYTITDFNAKTYLEVKKYKKYNYKLFFLVMGYKFTSQKYSIAIEKNSIDQATSHKKLKKENYTFPEFCFILNYIFHKHYNSIFSRPYIYLEKIKGVEEMPETLPYEQFFGKTKNHTWQNYCEIHISIQYKPIPLITIALIICLPIILLLRKKKKDHKADQENPPSSVKEATN